MTATHNSGPNVTYGQLGTAAGSGTGGVNPEAGPSITYQGDSIPDVRSPYTPGITGRGKILTHLDSPYLLTVDTAPYTFSTNGVATLAPAAIAGTAFTLGAYNTTNGIFPGAPLIPAGLGASAANVVKALVLDGGFGTCTTNGTAVISAIVNGAYLQPGSTVVVAGGPSNAWVAARVLVINAAGTTATLDTVISGTGTLVPIALANGQMDLNATPVAITPYLVAGAAAMFDPLQGTCRGLSIVSNNAGDTTLTATIKGYDLYGYPMTETLTANGTTAVYGKKAWKYITSVTSGVATSVGTISIGTSDVFGFNVRSDKYEYLNAYWNGGFLSANTGWAAAITTTATALTGDVRGTWQMSAIGGGTGASANSSNGVRRLALFMTIPAYNLVAATPQNPAPMYGVTQF